MRNAISVMMLFIASLLLVVGFANPPKETGDLYPRAFVIRELDYARDMVIVTDAVGMEWEFSEIDDWQIGDMVVAIMSDNGTNIMSDDYFVEIGWAGYYNPLAYWGD